MTKILPTKIPGVFRWRNSTAVLVFVAAYLLTISGCTPNDPYRSSERNTNTYYTSFDEPPKHLDPARSYSSNEYDFLAQIYEPLLEYHYLNRPYELKPLTAENVPSPTYLGKDKKQLGPGVASERVSRAVYEVRVKEGILYQPHPAFAKTPDGSPYYSTESEGLSGKIEIKEFSHTGTRELVSDDYIYQIKRLADPRVRSPIYSLLARYILGFGDFTAAISEELKEVRAKRKEAQGAAYNQQQDEIDDPIRIDYDKFPFPGVERAGDHAFRIILGTKYPQFVYWLAMPFFSPMPVEAIEFYSIPALAKNNITIDRFPVGTGPFMIETYNPNMEIVLKRNENYHEDFYPSEGEEGDKEAGLLGDAGKKLPFIERVVFKLEKETIPRWTKFLQGYYDSSGISSDSFDQAVTISSEGGAELTPMMVEKKIRLITSVRPSVYYMGFNMKDDVVGGLSDRAKKLRQAISIALDYEEYIEIFANGRGISAMGPLPPGIFGYVSPEEGGYNPYVYNYDETKKRAIRKPLKEARALMIEAGYPGGRDSLGRPLVIGFDNAWTGPDSSELINWFAKRLKLLGIQLENRTTDYNRFQEKMLTGNFQFFSWGWNADYPDPENFFFLLYGPNGKVDFKGENAANYSNPRFDRLFKEMENMENSPERLKIIGKMNSTVREDSPWIWGMYPVAYGLHNQWVKNIKSNSMANNTMKYLRIETTRRTELRREWNRPLFWPVVIAGIILLAISIPATLKVATKLGYGKDWN